MLKLPRVALLIQSNLEYGRGLLRGIGSYLQTHESWSVFYRVGMLPESLSPELRKWRPQGIIGQFETRQVLRQVRHLRIPTVNLFGLHEFRNNSCFGVDHAAISRMVADYFLELGYRNFAYCGFQKVFYSQRRGEAFVDYLARKGYSVEVFASPESGANTGVFEIEAAGQFDIPRIGRWLQAMPKPLALMAGTDNRARQVLEACRLFDCRVPEEVAVLGVGNDEVLCNLSDPPLTSVALRPEKIGYEAAALLGRLMKGESCPSEPTLHGPLCIVPRQSTNSLGMTDPLLRETIRFFQEHFTDGVSVADAARHVGVSRSTLQRRFVEILGRSPRDELVRVQLDRVQELLRGTTLSINKISEQTGFDYAESLIRLFKRKIGKTPTEYRSQFVDVL